MCGCECVGVCMGGFCNVWVWVLSCMDVCMCEFCEKWVL